MKPILIASGVVFSTSLCAVAGSWEEGRERGLDTYMVKAETGGRLTLVCDPDRVYNEEKPHGNLVVSMPHNNGGSRLVFLSAGGQQAAFDIVDGVALQRANADEWSKLLELLKAGGQIGVVTSRDSFMLSLDPLPHLNCS